MAFVGAGTLDLSLSQIAVAVGTSKRMLIHYFGDRETLETKALSLLEDRLRAQFAPSNFLSGVPGRTVIMALWDRATEPESLGVLRLVMDVSRRAWGGSQSARAFYREQQRLWTDLLLLYVPDETAIEDILQLFQGSLLAFLVTGNSAPGRRALTQAADRIRK
jgi:AcrR family transcriptional regulator